MKQKVVIVAYTFPPDDGIGARRWTKFAKYLHLAGCEVNVISFQKKESSKKSPWSDDVAAFKDRTYRIPYKQPYYIRKSVAKTPLEKASYHLSRTLKENTWKGYLYDAVIGSEKLIEKKLKKHYENGCRHFIVTGAPFYLCYYVSKFKLKNPDITVLSDFRDPWTWGAGYGYSAMSEKRMIEERKIERRTVENSSYVSCPTEVMRDKLWKLYPEYKQKIKLLPHCLDKDDVQFESDNTQRNDDIIKIVFGGTIYTGVEGNLKEFLQFIRESNQSGNEKKIYCEFYVANQITDSEILAFQNEYVTFEKTINSKEFLRKVYESDYYLTLYSNSLKDVVSTKFMELMYLTNNVLYIGEEGEISRFIETNEMGVNVDIQNINKSLNDAIFIRKRKELSDSNKNDDYYCESVILELMKLLKIDK